MIALPATHLRLGSSGNAILPASNTQRRAYDDISRAFGPGYNGQLAVVITPKGTSDLKTAATEVAQKIGAIPGVAAVSRPATGHGRRRGGAQRDPGHRPGRAADHHPGRHAARQTPRLSSPPPAPRTWSPD